MNRHVARDISYAHSAETRGGRAVIRAMEAASGRFGLIRRAAGYDIDVAAGACFWTVMKERYGVSLEVIGGSLGNLPKTGPLITVSNHPYGILDGLMLGHLLATRRGDFRILANAVFRKARDLDRVILPIRFDDNRAALAQNISTRAEALRYLGQGGAIGVFPGGTVSTAARPFGVPMDPLWRSFTAKMIAKSDAAVVPVYFDGHTSRLFQIASHLHPSLRMGLLIREFRTRVDGPLRVVIGKPLPRKELVARRANGKAMMDFLRRSTYELSPEPYANFDYGHEFEAKHRAPKPSAERVWNRRGSNGRRRF